jgi:hypothetical protein
MPGHSGRNDPSVVGVADLYRTGACRLGYNLVVAQQFFNVRQETNVSHEIGRQQC